MVSNELTKTLLLLAMAGAVTSALLVKLIMLITKIQGSFKPYKKATIYYLLVSIVLFSAVACLAYWSYLKNQQFFFLFYQAYFLLLGIVHIYCMQAYLKWSGNSNALWTELLFTLIAAISGSMGFLIVLRLVSHDGLTFYRFFSMDGLNFNMAASIIWFIIPWFINLTFQSALAIPNRVLKQWYYPVGEEIEEPDEDKLKNLLVVSFVFQKQVTDAHYTNFRAKAPVDMELGELFYYFINDYNERHPHDKIEFINDSGEPYGWVFHTKTRFYTIHPKLLAADKTIFSNGIRENEVIICSRSLD